MDDLQKFEIMPLPELKSLIDNWVNAFMQLTEPSTIKFVGGRIKLVNEIYVKRGGK